MSEHDPIRPSHYTDFEIQPIDAIRDWGLNFNLGNVVKYIARAGKKDPTKLAEDLRKAERYLQHEIASMAFPGDDRQETIFDVVARISMLTGNTERDVLEIALNLYLDAIEADQDGDDGGNDAEDDPAPFKPGDKVTFAIKDEFPATGVVREIRHESTFYVVDWTEMDGTKWDDQHCAHELVACDPEAAEPDPSKTVTCFRCAKCGMPIAAGVEMNIEYATGEKVSYHPRCYTGEAAVKPEAGSIPATGNLGF